MVRMQAHALTANSVSSGATTISKKKPSSWWCIISRSVPASNLRSIRKKVFLW